MVYPKQFVLIDTDRAVLRADLASERARDIDDNMVVMIMIGEPRRAYLKRFCRDTRAPDGYVIASIDGGRRSPYIPPADIDRLLPVVGVIFEDPTMPRIKGAQSQYAKPETE